MTDGQRRAYQQYAPSLRLDPRTVFDPRAAFGDTAPCFLEIGFGNGESLFSLAAANPANRYVGIELYRPGIGFLAARLAANAMHNLRFYEADATAVLRHCIPDATLKGILILFPDPWPKKRHHKRRLIQADFLRLLHDKLLPAGHLHVATDWPSYAQHIKALFESQQGWLPLANDAMETLLPGRTPSKYEHRAHQNHHPIWQTTLRKTSPLSAAQPPLPPCQGGRPSRIEGRGVASE